MNVNEYGVLFAFFVAFDMSANTGLSIEFVKPDGTVLTVSSPDVTAPNTPLVTPGPIFPANQYAQYTIQEGDIDQVGTWSARVIYMNSVIPQELISNVGTFVVDP